MELRSNSTCDDNACHGPHKTDMPASTLPWVRCYLESHSYIFGDHGSRWLVLVSADSPCLPFSLNMNVSRAYHRHQGEQYSQSSFANPLLSSLCLRHLCKDGFAGCYLTAILYDTFDHFRE